MTSSSLDFLNKNKFVVLQNAVSEQDCKHLSSLLFVLFDKGLTVKDTQCPKSDSIYNSEIFAELHKKFTKELSRHTGKNLAPTYTYARIYRKGEVLEKHIDRESCEYSVTITLDFDSKTVWPIFFENNSFKDEVKLEPERGDIILYKGQEIPHWRPKFKGNWQTQVFLHYIDSNGPNKEHVGDKKNRAKPIGHVTWPKAKNTQVANSSDVLINATDPNSIYLPPMQSDVFYIPTLERDLPGYCCYNTQFRRELMFTKEECQRIIEYSNGAYPASGRIGLKDGNVGVDKSIRNVETFAIPNTKENLWLFEKIAKAVMIANNEYFDFEIMGINSELQLLKYESTENLAHYNWHSDSGTQATSTRKISVSVQLSEPDDYEGGELQVNNYGTIITASKELGSVHLFPSYSVHRVTPVTKGIRYALVIWINGSRRFR